MTFVDSDDFTIDGGDLCITSGIGDLRDLVVYTSSGTFTKADYPYLARVKVRCQAAGGAGGSATGTAAGEAAAGGGGGGGGYAERWIEAADLNTVESVGVGAGGLADPNGPGDQGAGASFGSHCVASGGNGGKGGPGATLEWISVGGTGGSMAVGDVGRPGGDGSSGWAQGALQLRLGGRGGSSAFGGGRYGQATGDGLDGRANTGEGGSGGGIPESHATGSGGDGASGIVVVEVYG